MLLHGGWHAAWSPPVARMSQVNHSMHACAELGGTGGWPRMGICSKPGLSNHAPARLRTSRHGGKVLVQHKGAKCVRELGAHT